MAIQDKPGVKDPELDRSDDRYLGIAVAVMVVGLSGGMGINIFVHHDTNTETIQTTGAAQ